MFNNGPSKLYRRQQFSILSIIDLIVAKEILLQWIRNDSRTNLSFYDNEDRGADELHAQNQYKVMVAKSSAGYTGFV